MITRQTPDPTTTGTADRIRDDLYDRLREDPAIGASDITVSVIDAEVTLTGTVENRIALRQVHQIAEELVGPGHVILRLTVRGGEEHPTAGEEVDRAMPGPAGRE
jgi:osmotically-inducible protein OsmY